MNKINTVKKNQPKIIKVVKAVPAKNNNMCQYMVGRPFC